ncbi:MULTISPECIES: hypothetical protein [Chryseobacterium]|uniref:Uncharacterized protein n=1 Tax=Chryseobacterium rhizosphaerae TaxID=395937 RepID=A0AAE3YAU2_9FLAO|nr:MULTISPECIES: hypothetical protein [Chryseobacterium]MBL3547011.1 hypothetical protein [Chryseobacterium sp. KMC2]MDR6527107.1 hypothetical protein [Chryseobacterium rhizosphaerae]MDR6548214.1 hypothetical protein [Chryseobacterium rhizosphaerae]SMC79110.1 hypothetical protein SAMN02787074_3140 [Chryseobacterium sp. YR221]
MKTLINDSIGDLEIALKNNTDLQEKFKLNPVEALKNVEIRNPKDTDYWIYRIIVIMLGLAVLGIITGLILITMNNLRFDTQLITIFTAISSGAIGALAGLLAPSPNKQ